ncbi:hypothetical protein ALNOE001_03430 [Candidatus Methanobinarius endosymbioticus]|uniref:Uncharacterized protein n=1 Tax=Candidatus Methanobinarius endosymbioticus TaxID=2006182 RepID=A0A366MDA6_9EURY|nr:hypothetical protein ALNOE001_03430 [Candidatus Methanobinarius endosymbioticus]
MSLVSVSAADISIDNSTIGGISDARLTANNEDTIYLQEGIYKGTNNTDLTIDKNITFIGSGSSNKVIIDVENTRKIFSSGFSNFVNVKFTCSILM